ncbi:putative N-acetyltransferase YitI [Hypsizygus marmoreus]|uniref:N-acetyltransferase YitI n=1 Tax=Hypsizygus marmoreus TaxID=39966 RepID=A0A369J8M2_HYPMA|nr:putative N-acetyltransferase YitI [Hypsizygus marmoreus]
MQSSKLPINTGSDLGLFCAPITVEQTLPLRHSVLWPNKPISHVYLPEDEAGLHLGAFVGSLDEPVAVISLFIEPLPVSNNVPFDQDHGVQSNVMRFRKFACDPTYQGRGIGSRLLQFSLERAHSELNCTIAWCDARTSASAWYIKRGMMPFGERFFKGPVEYIRMCIDIGPRSTQGTDIDTRV